MMKHSDSSQQEAGGRREQGNAVWRWLAWMMLALCLLAGLSYGVYYAAQRAWHAVQRASGLSEEDIKTVQEVRKLVRESPAYKPAPAHVFIGSRLPWRTIAKGVLWFNLNGTLITGQFDADADDELLFANDNGKSTLYELEGSSRPAGLSLAGIVFNAVAWDYNGDGVDEVVTDHPFNWYTRWSNLPVPPQFANVNPSLNTPVFDVAGGIVALLPCNSFGSPPLLGDFNGDGKQELMLYDDQSTGKAKRLFYKAEGARLPTSLLPFIGMYAQAADIDGDGNDEVVESVYKQDETGQYSVLRAYRPGDTTAQALAPRIVGSRFALTDVDADGKPELVSARQWEELDGTRVVPFQFPTQLAQAESTFAGAYMLDLLGRGQPQLALLYSLDTRANALLLFDASGQCLYYEELGSRIAGSGLARAGGKRYLVVQTDGSIKVCPES